MTRYDPFAYGEVRLDPDQQKKGDDGPPSSDPDDVLFAGGEDVKQAPPADSSWALMNEDVEDLLPGGSSDAGEAAEFGAEILGEDDGGPDLMPKMMPAMESTPDVAPTMQAPDESDYAPAAPMPEMREPAPAPSHAPPPPPPQSAPEPEVAGQPVGPPPRRRVKRQPLHRPVAATSEPADAPAAAKKPPVPRRRRMPVLAAMMPVLICAVGGTAASWFWVMQQNPVMAGILGAGTLVSALFAWLLLRG